MSDDRSSKTLVQELRQFEAWFDGINEPINADRVRRAADELERLQHDLDEALEALVRERQERNLASWKPCSICGNPPHEFESHQGQPPHTYSPQNGP
jgi:hypothetical protein